MTKNNFWLSAILFSTFSVTLYYCSPYDGHFCVDSPGYDLIAKNFAQTNHLENPEQQGIIPIQVVGYPLFIGIMYKLFGYHLWLVVLVQVLLCLLCMFLIYRIAERLFNTAIANFTTFICAFNPGFLIFSQFIMTEILMMTLLTIWLDQFTIFIYSQNLSAVFIASVILGISTWVKPIALYFLPIWLIFIYMFSKSNSNVLLVKTMCLSALLFYLPVMIYMGHNRLLYGTWQFAPTAQESLYCYFLPKLIVSDKKISTKQALDQIANTFANKTHNDSSRWDQANQLLKEYLYNKPFLVLTTWCQNVTKTMFGLFSSQLKILLDPALKLKTCLSFFSCHTNSVLTRIYYYCINNTNKPFVKIFALLEAFYTVVRFFLVLIALSLLFQNRKPLFLLFFIICFYFIIVTGHDGCARFRMMVEPFLIILTAVALDFVYTYRTLIVQIKHQQVSAEA